MHLCVISGLTPAITSKDSRGVPKCKDDKCILFIPEEKYISAVEYYESKVNSRCKPNKLPLCRCNKVCSLWVSTSENNPGRGYVCVQQHDEHEKYILLEWANKLRRERKQNTDARVNSKEVKNLTKKENIKKEIRRAKRIKI
jgi:hypothetical protein